MAPINTTIDDLQIHLPQWVSELPLYQLIEEANIYIGTSSLAYIGKFSHNFESTGQKLEIFSSKSSKQDEKDKTADKHKIAKGNLSPKKRYQAANLPPNYGYDMSEKWWVHTRLTRQPTPISSASSSPLLVCNIPTHCRVPLPSPLYYNVLLWHS